jgi:hypothetical protein
MFNVEGTNLQELPMQYNVVKTPAIHCHSDFVVLLSGILQGVERPGSSTA